MRRLLVGQEKVEDEIARKEHVHCSIACKECSLRLVTRLAEVRETGRNEKPDLVRCDDCSVDQSE